MKQNLIKKEKNLMEENVVINAVEPVTPVVEAAEEAAKEMVQAIQPVEVPTIVVPQKPEKMLDLSKFDLKKDGVVLGSVVLTTVAVVKITEKIAAAKPITKMRNGIKRIWDYMKNPQDVNLTDQSAQEPQSENPASTNETPVQQPANNPAPQA